MLRPSDTRFSHVRKSLIIPAGLLAALGAFILISMLHIGSDGAVWPGALGGVSPIEALTLLVLVAASLLAGTASGERLHRALGQVLQPIRTQLDKMIRGGCGLYFVALWAQGHTIVTPEATTTSLLVPLLQLGIACCMLWRETLIIGAACIIGLIALALHEHVAVHLVDGVSLLTLATYLFILGLSTSLQSLRPVDAARWMLAATLIVISVVSLAHPRMNALVGNNLAQTSGLDGDLFTRGEEIVSFALGAALLWTPLCRRISALVLAGVAFGVFVKLGKADAVACLPILLLAVAIAADDVSGLLERRSTLFTRPSKMSSFKDVRGEWAIRGRL